MMQRLRDLVECLGGRVDLVLWAMVLVLVGGWLAGW